MLVLTRKLQQQIKIGENITVTILKVKGSTVRLGIAAPRDVRVVRSELPPEVVEVEATLEEVGDLSDSEDSAIAAYDEERPLVVGSERPSGKPGSSRSRLRFNMPPVKPAAAIPVLAK